MALLYKGYAQQKGFGAYQLKVQDPAEKIRQQGLQAMGHMKDQIEWSNKQANRLADHIDSNNKLEAKQNKENFELGQDLNQVIHDQKMRNFDDRIAADKARTRANEKKWQSILSLTKSGTALFQAYKGHQEKAASDYGHMLWEEHGIGLKKLNAVQDMADEIWNDSSAREAELARLGLDGVSKDVIQQMRSLSGYKKIAIAKQDARRWALRRPEYYSKNWDKEVELPGGLKTTLGLAQGAQVDSVLQILDKQARDELGANAPSSKILALSGGYQLLEHARTGVRGRKHKLAQQEAEDEQHNDEKIIIDDAISHGPDGEINVGAGIIKSIEYYAGPNPTPADYRRAKKRVFAALKDGLTEGYWDASKFEGAGDYEFKHSSGTVKISKIFKREWLEIEDAMVNGTNREYNVASIAKKQNSADDRKYLGEIMAIDNPTAEDLGRMLSIAGEKDWNESKTYISNQLTRMQSDTADEAMIGIVRDAIKENRHMTRQQVLELGGSPAGNSIAFQMLNENSKFLPETYGHDETIDSQTEAWLESRIPTPMTGKQDSTRETAKRAILTLARSQYKAFMTKPGANPEDALQHALSYAKEKVFKSSDFEPRFDRVTGLWGFPIGMIQMGADKLEMDYSVLAEKIQTDKSVIYNEPLMDANSLRIKSENLNKGIQQDLLPRSVFIESSSAGSVKALETEMAQIEHLNKKLQAEGKPLIRQYPDWYVKQVTDTYKKINTDVIRLLNKYDYCKVNQAACTSGSNPVYTRPAYEKAREIVRGTLGTPDSGDWNATENGSSVERTDLKKVHLTNASLAEITTLQERGLIITAGRYQFTAEELLEAIDLAGLSLHTMFDADTQNKLFDAYFKKNGPRMTDTMDNEEDKFLLQDIHESVTSDKLSDLRFRAPRTLNVAAYKELVRRGYYAA